MRDALVCVAFTILLLPSSGFAGDGTARERPRIGLALGGGAARALAHIGVLEWLDEHHIPVDYIAGTSMGALIGAAYATGSLPGEIRTNLRNVDWDVVMQGSPSFRNLSFRRKEDRRDFPNMFELGFRHGLRLPIGLNGGHSVGMILDRIALPYYDIKGFDDLPIPFRCVATDVSSAKAVVFKDGPLSEALRATMAVPGLFAPIEIGGKLLADGGLLNNLPVDVVKSMGADVVIAAQISLPSTGSSETQSFISMVNRSIDIMILENENRNLRLADVVLTLETGQYTSTDYKASDAIADLGYANTDRKKFILERLSVDDEAWEKYLEARRSRVKTSMPVPQFVHVEGTRAEAEKTIARTLAPYVGKRASPAQIEGELARMTGWGRYESLGYNVARAGNQPGLRIQVREKQHGPPFLNLGVEVNAADPGYIKFNVTGRLTLLDLGGYRAEWRTDVSLGARSAISTEYYRPIAGRGWFVAPRAFAESMQSDLYQHQSRVAEYQINQAGFGLNAGYSFGRFSELRAGYEPGHMNAYVRVGDPLLPRTNGRLDKAFVRWIYDGLDSPLVPMRGRYITAETDWVLLSPGAPHDFPRTEIRVRSFHPICANGSFFLVAAGGTTYGEEAPPINKFTLGGPLRLGALGLDEIRTNQYWYGAAGYLHQIWHLSPLMGGRIYAAGWHEMAKAFQMQDFSGYNHTGSAGFVVDTVFGPLFLGGSVSEHGRRKFYFLLGKLF